VVRLQWSLPQELQILLLHENLWLLQQLLQLPQHFAQDFHPLLLLLLLLPPNASTFLAGHPALPLLLTGWRALLLLLHHHHQQQQQQVLQTAPAVPCPALLLHAPQTSPS
jgi:hypothetical protein